jgi:hypothetical protein
MTMTGPRYTSSVHSFIHSIHLTISHCSSLANHSFRSQSRLFIRPITVLGLANNSFSFVIRQARTLHPVIVDKTSPIIVTYLYLTNHGTSQPSTTVLSQPIRTLHQKHSLISHGASSSQSELCISSNIATVFCKPVALPQSDQKRLSSDLSSLSFSKSSS